MCALFVCLFFGGGSIVDGLSLTDHYKQQKYKTAAAEALSELARRTAATATATTSAGSGSGGAGRDGGAAASSSLLLTDPEVGSCCCDCVCIRASIDTCAHTHTYI